eukprot:g3115.t1
MFTSIKPPRRDWVTLGTRLLPTLSPHRILRSRLVPSRCLGFRLGAVPAEVAKEVVTRPVPRSAPIHPSKQWTDLSGQQGTAFFDAPMCGKSDAFGAHFESQISGTNFALFSSGATGVSLVLFKESDLNRGTFAAEIPLDPVHNKTGDVWHIALPNIQEQNLLYGYKVTGPNQEDTEEQSGHKYDDSSILVDPYGTTVFSRRQFGVLGPDLDYEEEALGLSRTWPVSASWIPTGQSTFDWEGDKPLNLPLEDLVIYELHVRGFTQDASSKVSSPGTYKALVEKLDYLDKLGVNCVELMPIHEFNELEYYELIPGTETYRFNVWGYSTVNFFSPMSRYSASVASGGSRVDLLNEFKTMVKECHKKGIEVILDVVFNHTAEGNHQGPSLSFRGLDNRVYYMLAPAGEYYNYSGCGNTFNCNHPVVRQFIVDCLKYWVTEMHIDGFRFDLASIMTRAHSTWHQGETHQEGPRLASQGDGIVDDRGHMECGAGETTGTPLSDPSLIAMISEEPILRNTKLIAEAWDCDGLNQVGAFPHYGGRWAEWNGRFRDVVRNFIKGTDGSWAGDFASVVCGSPDLYRDHSYDASDWWRMNGGKKWSGGRGPMHSVNFVTAHDGFSLADLVSFNQKHNEANGENNQDGESHNLSWNSGAEGITGDPYVKRLRRRQIRNLFCALFLSHGVPMMLMGDEYGHSKGGNNNTYCHDDYLNWFNWDQASNQNSELSRFVRLLLKFRFLRNEFRRKDYVIGDDIVWHGETPYNPDWSKTSRFVAYTIKGAKSSTYVAYNTSHVSKIIQLPDMGGMEWQLVVDTGANPPFDVLLPDGDETEEEVEVLRASKKSWTDQSFYPMHSYSCIVLVTRQKQDESTEHAPALF